MMKPLKSSSPEPKSYDFETWHTALETEALQSYIDDDPGLTLSYFTTMSNYYKVFYWKNVLEKYNCIQVSKLDNDVLEWFWAIKKKYL